ncbi:hypothetical protein [Actinomadura madurae]|uniref:hypothetical protein n=1 Tax=Actinomadura madurae TaxID=1993 RepID=UPI0020D2505A|nr:hypothetical protein [Actinomadura madurae]MCQ0008659.1 hypothetical protein [Actinomadura madurae]
MNSESDMSMCSRATWWTGRSTGTVSSAASAPGSHARHAHRPVSADGGPGATAARPARQTRT